MGYLPWDRQMNRGGYLARIIAIAATRGVAGIVDNDTRWDALRLDSLDFVDLINAIDSEFAVEIPGESSAKFETVGDMIDWLEEKEPAEYDLPA